MMKKRKNINGRFGTNMQMVTAFTFCVQYMHFKHCKSEVHNARPAHTHHPVKKRVTAFKYRPAVVLLQSIEKPGYRTQELVSADHVRG